MNLREGKTTKIGEFSNKDRCAIIAESFDNFLIKTCSVKNRPLRKLHYLKFQVANTRYEVESEAEPFSSVSVFIRDNFGGLTFANCPVSEEV